MGLSSSKHTLKSPPPSSFQRRRSTALGGIFFSSVPLSSFVEIALTDSSLYTQRMAEAFFSAVFHSLSRNAYSSFCHLAHIDLSHSFLLSEARTHVLTTRDFHAGVRWPRQAFDHERDDLQSHLN